MDGTIRIFSIAIVLGGMAVSNHLRYKYSLRRQILPGGKCMNADPGVRLNIL